MEGCAPIVGASARGVDFVREGFSSNGNASATTTELGEAVVMDFEGGFSVRVDFVVVVVLEFGGGFSAGVIFVRAKLLIGG